MQRWKNFLSAPMLWKDGAFLICRFTSFTDCSSTVCHDGSDNDLIHCLKREGQVPQDRFVLQNTRAWLYVERSQEEEELDAEQDEENGFLINNSDSDDCVVEID
uniref:Uncharacterized protein n=1 Tax=Ditylenchus dipsaci TaxID=166011 RepID=A0A915E3F2_9BILA